MVVTIKIQLTINGKFYATGPCAPLLKNYNQWASVNGIKFSINSKFHCIFEIDWLRNSVAMVVTIDGKATIDGKVYATGPRIICNQCIHIPCLGIFSLQ